MTQAPFEVRRDIESTTGTVLFADLRGYTSLAERLSPIRVVGLLEEFFALLCEAVQSQAGQIYHMAGDGMMAGFGFHQASQNGTREALTASQMMLHRFPAIAERWQQELSIGTGLGVGLHFGEVALGFLGPPGRQAITLVGDTVNVAARLCSRARTGEVLFSDTVAEKLGAAYATGMLQGFLHLQKLELRGRSAPLDIWCLPAAARIALRDATTHP
jgi:adenylate cyclase